MSELTVPGDPTLAVRDFGGEGPPVVLLHGFGGNVLHWEPFAALLTSSHRVLAVDLRCHGRSGNGPVTWELLVDDVERVVDRLELGNPAVVGHSWGGGVAAWWATRHPDCPGAVDLDGVRGVETEPGNYVGLDTDRALELRSELGVVFDATAKELADPLTADRLAARRDELRALGGDAAVAVFDRNLVTVDGQTFQRPDADTVTTFRARRADIELFGAFAAARCPLLVCTAARDLPGTERFAELEAAYRRGVERDLAAVTALNPYVRVERVDASHDMVRERPAELAALVTGFLGTGEDG